MKFEWVPLKKIGAFEFGAPIKDYLKIYDLIELPDEYDEKEVWTVYTISDFDVRIFAEEGNIVSVSCYEEFIYKGKNLIGLNLREVIDLIGVQPNKKVDIIYIDNEQKRVYELEDVSAQLWVKDGKVVTIFCGPAYDD